MNPTFSDMMKIAKVFREHANDEDVGPVVALIIGLPPIKSVPEKPTQEVGEVTEDAPLDFHWEESIDRIVTSESETTSNSESLGWICFQNREPVRCDRCGGMMHTGFSNDDGDDDRSFCWDCMDMMYIEGRVRMLRKAVKKFFSRVDA